MVVQMYLSLIAKEGVYVIEPMAGKTYVLGSVLREHFKEINK